MCVCLCVWGVGWRGGGQVSECGATVTVLAQSVVMETKLPSPEIITV